MKNIFMFISFKSHTMVKRCLMSMLIVLGIFAFASSSFAINVWFEPSPSTIQTGDSFELTLLADTSDEPITGFGLEIVFDSAYMTLNSIENRDEYAYPYFDVDGNIVNGGSGPFAIAFESDALVLATLNFTCLAVGQSVIGLAAALGDSQSYGFEYTFWMSSETTYYDWTFTQAVINQTESTEPVPEPATMLLLGSGLVGLAGFRRRIFRK